MLPLTLLSTLLLGAGLLVYAMHVRGELSRLAVNTRAAWSALDDALARRRDRLREELVRWRNDETFPATDIARLERALATQDEIRHAGDLLRLGSTERQIRAVTGRPGLAPADIAMLERDILALTDAYDGLASLYNIRLRRLPGNLFAMLERLEPLPLIEFIEPFGRETTSVAAAGPEAPG
jgi:hypothetical protein